MSNLFIICSKTSSVAYFHEIIGQYHWELSTYRILLDTWTKTKERFPYLMEVLRNINVLHKIGKQWKVIDALERWTLAKIDPYKYFTPQTPSQYLLSENPICDDAQVPELRLHYQNRKYQRGKWWKVIYLVLEYCIGIILDERDEDLLQVERYLGL